MNRRQNERGENNRKKRREQDTIKRQKNIISTKERDGERAHTRARVSMVDGSCSSSC